MLIIRVCIVILLSLLPILGEAQQSFFQHLNKSNGLSNQSITAFYQDELERIWIGTRDGLNVFNGSTVKGIDLFIKGGRQVGNSVASVSGNRRGEIYIGDYSGVLAYNLYSEKVRQLSSGMYPFLAYVNDRLYAPRGNAIYYYSEEKGEFVHQTNYSELKLTPNHIAGDVDGRLYVGTDAGLFVITPEGTVSRFFDAQNVYYVYEDRMHNLWLATVRDGLLHCTKGGELIKEYRAESGETRLMDNFVRAVCEDKQGNVWIGTQRGLNKLTRTTNVITPIPSSVNNPFGTSNASIRALFADKLGTIWCGSYYGGVDYFLPESVFHHYYGQDNNMLSLPINQLTSDNRNNLWICFDGGLMRMNRSSGECKVYDTKNSDLPTNSLKTILYDEREGCLWLGMNVYGLCRFDLESERITSFSLNSGTNSLRNGNVRKLLKYGDQLYISSHYSVEVLDVRSGSITPLFSHDVADYFGGMKDVALSKDDKLWFCGDKRLGCYDLLTQKVVYSDDDVDFYNCLFVDAFNNLWCGTDNNGVVIRNPNTGKKERYNSANVNFISDKIIGISQGNSRYVTLATGQGISYFIPSSKSLINIDNRELPPLVAVNEYGLSYTKEGQLYVSGINGLFSFPEEAALNKTLFSIPIIFTDLYVNNEKRYPGEEGIMSRALPFEEEITLRSHHITFSVFFSIPDYTHRTQKLTYKLEGFDQEWVGVEGENKVTYTNLDPGRYTLKVRNRETNQFRELRIRVLPPFYKSWYAYLLYIIIIGGVGYWLFKEYTERIALKTSLLYVEKEKEQIEDLNQAKLRFFTNISHEFRTPLTLIIGQIELLIQQNSFAPTVNSILQKTLANAYRLRRLITELIEFRKQEQGYMKLHVQQQDVNIFVEEIYTAFRELAQSRDIRYTFECDGGVLPLWFDPQQLEKVLINLLANAFKNTPAGESVTVSVTLLRNQWVRVAIADTGHGIPADSLDKVFNRFYQVDFGKSSSELEPGSGIGLSLSKGIIDDHKGEIGVESQCGKGTTFSVLLRIGTDHFSAEQLLITQCADPDCDKEYLSVLGGVLPMDKPELLVANNDTLLPRMLVVEDNSELLQLLAAIFYPYYRVRTAINGEEGIVEAVNFQPDIVLSDVYMPIMSGIDMCAVLKSKSETCHIPIVLLTAQGASDFVVEGLEKGADDYILKPFDSRVLLARINGIVQNRKRLKQLYATTLEMPVEEIVVNEIDSKLLTKAIAVIMDNLSNPDFNVETLARELAMSKSSLYSKFNGVTGQTPNEFVLNVRLKSAAEQLLKDQEVSVLEVSERCGFSSPGYFIKCFKKLFGHTPHVYRSVTTRA